MNIVLIGSGHVAYHFGRAFFERGFSVQQVYSRTPEHAKAFAGALGAEPLTDLQKVSTNADLYIIAVQDNAIESVVGGLPDDLAGIVVHTSGATSSKVLERFGQYGVIYPLQSVRKEVDIDLRQIPLAVEGNTAPSEKQLLQLAGLLSDHTFSCSSEQRLVLHLSAVFANNFTNALFDIAYNLAERHNLSFDLLKPIILKTAENVQNHPPSAVQTGPAMRNDQNTIQRHLDFLKKYPEYWEIYSVVSDYIQKRK